MELNKIYLGDCKEIMKTFPDNAIDLTVTSPPYDNLRDYKGYSFDFEEIAKELYRITKDGGVVVWVVGDATIDGSETGTSFRQALFFKEIGFNLHDTMIYQKNSSARPSSNRYWQQFEYMFVFSKGTPKTVNLIKDKRNRWAGSSNWGKHTNRQKDGELKEGKSSEINEFGIRYNVWKYNVGMGYTTKEKFAYEHPAMFPEKLAKDHIISWSDKGDVVLDCFCGSGTTLKMAKLSGRDFIGIDISEEYVELSKRRIRQENLETWFK